VDLRAICRSWRSATDDPKNDRWDSRFRPRQWIILDDVSDTRHLLLNTATGRFLYKELPLLRDYYVVATTLGGFFVLADKSPPHAARVFNPLTGDIIHFTVPMPVELEVAVVLLFASSVPILSLFCDSSCKIYKAVPHSFITRDNYKRPAYNFLRREVGGAMDGRWVKLFGRDDMVGSKIRDLITVLNDVDPFPFNVFSMDPLPEMGAADDARCFPMEFSGQLLIIINRQRTVEVFKLEAGSNRRVPVRSIGNHAIFTGPHRCLAVDANVFPSVEANCVYYTEHLSSSARIRKCNIQDGKSERISEAFDFVKRDKHFVLVADRPFTIIQLLSSYTINIGSSELAVQQITQGADKQDD
jgi:hypothetical protein